jgi:hypothetical protein
MLHVKAVSARTSWMREKLAIRTAFNLIFLPALFGTELGFACELIF